MSEQMEIGFWNRVRLRVLHGDNTLLLAVVGLLSSVPLVGVIKLSDELASGAITTREVALFAGPPAAVAALGLVLLGLRLTLVDDSSNPSDSAEGFGVVDLADPKWTLIEEHEALALKVATLERAYAKVAGGGRTPDLKGTPQ